MFQDFRRGMSDFEIRGWLNELVYEVAHVKDVLKEWLQSTGRSDALVENYVKHHCELQIIIDLANVDKHNRLRHKPHSGLRPQLQEVGRALQLSTGSEDGPSTAVFTFDALGRPKVITTGGGTANVVFLGDVVDESGNRVGDLYEIASKAVAQWQRLFADLGLGFD